MKKLIIYSLFALILMKGQSLIAQNTLAKIKFEDAEKAFNEARYEECLKLLNETEEILGQGAPNILYLRIIASEKVLATNPYHSYELIAGLRKNCSDYLTNYDIAGLEEKYRDIYEVSTNLDKYPKSKENFDSELASIKEEQQLIISNLEKNMVSIPGGTFIMGNKKGYYKSQQQEHSVTLGDFKMSQYPITVKEYKTFIDQTGYKDTTAIYQDFMNGKLTNVENSKNVDWRFDSKDNLLPIESYNRPVIHISWNDAMAFCKWFSEVTGTYYRLPTEAEWEYTARDGQNDNNGKWWEKDYQIFGWFKENALGKLHDVGEKKPNNYGIYDLYGGIGTFCFDYYDENFYAVSPKSNPSGPSHGKNRITRGYNIYASYLDIDRALNPISRRFVEPQNVRNLNSVIGFRIVAPQTPEGKLIAQEFITNKN